MTAVAEGLRQSTAPSDRNSKEPPVRPTSILLATALATVTLASPATAQSGPGPLQWREQPSQDLRSGDARDASEAARNHQDFRSPDAPDAAAQDSITGPAERSYRDLRSPDARNAGDVRATDETTTPDSYQDLRTPDARDAADGRSMAAAAAPIIEITRASRFDWGDAAIGAGGAIGMLAIALAGAMTVRRHRRPRRTRTALI
jgi:hypothetical protein